jgi:carbonic anhydrase
MSPVKVIEKLLLRECTTSKEPTYYDSCIVCASPVAWRIVSLFPESYVIANGAAQVYPNLASVYYAVEELKVSLLAIVGTTAVDLEPFIKMNLQTAEFEFKLLKKDYEENAEILYSLYEGNRKLFNAALVEINLDSQIEKLLSIPEIKGKVEEQKLAVCGRVLDEDLLYGNKPSFYLINFNGIKDPDELRNCEALSEIPESVRKQKIKRIHLQI